MPVPSGAVGFSFQNAEKMDVLKGEEGKRVASGGAALSADERRAALPGAVRSRVANWPREVCSRVRCFPEQRDKRHKTRKG